MLCCNKQVPTQDELNWTVTKLCISSICLSVGTTHQQNGFSQILFVWQFLSKHQRRVGDYIPCQTCFANRSCTPENSPSQSWYFSSFDMPLDLYSATRVLSAMNSVMSTYECILLPFCPSEKKNHTTFWTSSHSPSCAINPNNHQLTLETLVQPLWVRFVVFRLFAWFLKSPWAPWSYFWCTQSPHADVDSEMFEIFDASWAHSTCGPKILSVAPRSKATGDKLVCPKDSDAHPWTEDPAWKHLCLMFFCPAHSHCQFWVPPPTQQHTKNSTS